MGRSWSGELHHQGSAMDRSLLPLSLDIPVTPLVIGIVVLSTLTQRAIARAVLARSVLPKFRNQRIVPGRLIYSVRLNNLFLILLFSHDVLGALQAI